MYMYIIPGENLNIYIYIYIYVRWTYKCLACYINDTNDLTPEGNTRSESVSQSGKGWSMEMQRIKRNTLMYFRSRVDAFPLVEGRHY